MPYFSSPNPYPQPFGRISRGAPDSRSDGRSDRNIIRRPIFNIDDDSLLNVFYLYRLACIECEGDKTYIYESVSGGGGWAREHWWCTLVRVCRKWRYLIFGSPSYLGLCIAYASGTHAAPMLAHPPFFRLPLVIEYIHRGLDKQISLEDKRKIILMLQHRHRVRGIRVHAPYSETVFRALDGEFPILVCLNLKIPNGPSFNWEPPSTFRTPSLQRLVLHNVMVDPLPSPLLTPATGLVTLSLTEICEPHKLSPNDLLQQLSLMPHLETLRIGFTLFSGSPRETQILGNANLPCLRQFLFNGTSIYLSALLPHISTPPLEKLQIYISDWQTHSIPYALGLMSGSENFKSYSADLMFLDEGVFMRANLSDGTRWSGFSMSLHGDDLTWQVLSAARFIQTHRTCFSTTKYLTVRCRTPASRSPHHGPDRVQLHGLFGLLGNVKALLVYDGRHGEISRYFQINHGESAMVLFPRLTELKIHTSRPYQGACAPFIKARMNAGYPVHLVHVGGGPSAAEVVIICEAWEVPWLWGSFRLRLR